MTVDERRGRVEHGLTAVLQVEGRPATPYTLAERMQRYDVPGVAVAVVDDGEIAWSAGYGVRADGQGPIEATTLLQAISRGQKPPA